MKSREFTINVPITIKINGDGDPEIDAPGQDNAEEDKWKEPQQNPVMVNPLQQDLELRKAALGKTSPVIDKLTQSDDLGNEDAAASVDEVGDAGDADDNLLVRIRQLISKLSDR
tara:strand:+ start:333 stop:674 length:342 start_codon:yes stop_codon:yes gene_type:complete